MVKDKISWQLMPFLASIAFLAVSLIRASEFFVLKRVFASFELAVAVALVDFFEGPDRFDFLPIYFCIDVVKTQKSLASD